MLFEVIRRPVLRKHGLNTPISGIQAQDLFYGEQEEIVKDKILKMIKNHRIICHGSGDLPSLGITNIDIKDNSIEVVNTQDLWGKDGNNHTIGLQLRDAFWYGGRLLRRDGYERTSPINGHSPERDSRLTLLIYRKYHSLKEKFGIGPTAGELRQANVGYNYTQWLKDYGLQDPDDHF